MAKGDESREESLEDFVLITVLAKGSTINYVVPSFPVFGAKLTEVKLQWDDGGEEVMIFDGFARSCEALDHHLPAVLKVEYSYENAFIIEVGEEAALYNTVIYLLV